MQNQKEYKEFSIRIPVELDDLIQQDALQNKRSKSKQVNFVLEEYYAEKIAQNVEKQPVGV